MQPRSFSASLDLLWRDGRGLQVCLAGPWLHKRHSNAACSGTLWPCTLPQPANLVLPPHVSEGPAP